MLVTSVEPKDVEISIAFSLQELLLLIKGLNATELQLNLESDEDREVSMFMTETLYKTVSDVVEALVPK